MLIAEIVQKLQNAKKNLEIHACLLFNTLHAIVNEDNPENQTILRSIEVLEKITELKYILQSKLKASTPNSSTTLSMQESAKEIKVDFNSLLLECQELPIQNYSQTSLVHLNSTLKALHMTNKTIDILKLTLTSNEEEKEKIKERQEEIYSPLLGQKLEHIYFEVILQVQKGFEDDHTLPTLNIPEEAKDSSYEKTLCSMLQVLTIDPLRIATKESLESNHFHPELYALFKKIIWFFTEKFVDQRKLKTKNSTQDSETPFINSCSTEFSWPEGLQDSTLITDNFWIFAIVKFFTKVPYTEKLEQWIDSPKKETPYYINLKQILQNPRIDTKTIIQFIRTELTNFTNKLHNNESPIFKACNLTIKNETEIIEAITIIKNATNQTIQITSILCCLYMLTLKNNTCEQKANYTNIHYNLIFNKAIHLLYSLKEPHDILTPKLMREYSKIVDKLNREIENSKKIVTLSYLITLINSETNPDTKHSSTIHITYTNNNLDKITASDPISKDEEKQIIKKLKEQYSQTQSSIDLQKCTILIAREEKIPQRFHISIEATTIETYIEDLHEINRKLSNSKGFDTSMHAYNMFNALTTKIIAQIMLELKEESQTLHTSTHLKAQPKTITISYTAIINTLRSNLQKQTQYKKINLTITYDKRVSFLSQLDLSEEITPDEKSKINDKLKEMFPREKIVSSVITRNSKSEVKITDINILPKDSSSLHKLFETIISLYTELEFTILTHEPSTDTLSSQALVYSQNTETLKQWINPANKAQQRTDINTQRNLDKLYYTSKPTKNIELQKENINKIITITGNYLKNLLEAYIELSLQYKETTNKSNKKSLQNKREQYFLLLKETLEQIPPSEKIHSSIQSPQISPSTYKSTTTLTHKGFTDLLEELEKIHLTPINSEENIEQLISSLEQYLTSQKFKRKNILEIERNIELLKSILNSSKTTLSKMLIEEKQGLTYTNLSLELIKSIHHDQNQLISHNPLAHIIQILKEGKTIPIKSSLIIVKAKKEKQKINISLANLKIEPEDYIFKKETCFKEKLLKTLLEKGNSFCLPQQQSSRTYTLKDITAQEDITLLVTDKETSLDKTIIYIIGATISPNSLQQALSTNSKISLENINILEKIQTSKQQATSATHSCLEPYQEDGISQQTHYSKQRFVSSRTLCENHENRKGCSRLGDIKKAIGPGEFIWIKGWLEDPIYKLKKVPSETLRNLHDQGFTLLLTEPRDPHSKHQKGYSNLTTGRNTNYEIPTQQQRICLKNNETTPLTIKGYEPNTPEYYKQIQHLRLTTIAFEIIAETKLLHFTCKPNEEILTCIQCSCIAPPHSQQLAMTTISEENLAKISTFWHDKDSEKRAELEFNLYCACIQTLCGENRINLNSNGEPPNEITSLHKLIYHLNNHTQQEVSLFENVGFEYNVIYTFKKSLVFSIEKIEKLLLNTLQTYKHTSSLTNTADIETRNKNNIWLYILLMHLNIYVHDDSFENNLKKKQELHTTIIEILTSILTFHFNTYSNEKTKKSIPFPERGFTLPGSPISEEDIEYSYHHTGVSEENTYSIHDLTCIVEIARSLDQANITAKAEQDEQGQLPVSSFHAILYNKIRSIDREDKVYFFEINPKLDEVLPSRFIATLKIATPLKPQKPTKTTPAPIHISNKEDLEEENQNILSAAFST